MLILTAIPDSRVAGSMGRHRGQAAGYAIGNSPGGVCKEYAGCRGFLKAGNKKSAPGEALPVPPKRRGIDNDYEW